MRFADLLRTTIAGLRAHQVRVLLTMFGIAWGVLSITLMVAAGEGLRQGQARQAATMGKDLVILWAGRTSLQAGGQRAGRNLYFTTSDATVLAQETPDCRAILPEATRRVLARSSFNAGSFTVTGSIPEYRHFRSIEIELGRFYSPREVSDGARVAILGSNVARQIFGARPVLGQNITLNGMPYQVAGLMKRKEQDSDYNGRDVEKIFVPLNAVLRDFPVPNARAQDQLDNLLVVPRSPDLHDLCLSQAERTLGRLHGFQAGDKEALPRWDTLKEAKAFGKMTEGMKVFLGAVGVVTLLLGGIGVMNVMLVAVRERTHEIGVRKALGATRSSIVAQFFAEALLIVGASGLGGLAIAWTLCYLVNQLEMPPFFDGLIADWRLAAWSMALLGVVGVASALYPATRAAMVDPVEALRHEAGG
jgi:putative ABC transport system permease protein